jgi:hypothetical protein
MSEFVEMNETPESQRRRIERAASRDATQRDQDKIWALLDKLRAEIGELHAWRIGLEGYLAEFLAGTDARLLDLEAVIRENGLTRPKRGTEAGLEGRASREDEHAMERRERA